MNSKDYQNEIAIYLKSYGTLALPDLSVPTYFHLVVAKISF